MSLRFEELDYRETSIGELSLRRRLVSELADLEVYEIKLRDSFLMSSLFHEAEVALADLALAGREGPMDVVVGGLGLGYTAKAALGHPAVRSVLVVEALEPVIDWHRSHLVPLGKDLCGDPRCRLLHGDFFKMAQTPASGFDPTRAGERVHAILLDIDHSPRNLLADSSASFYSTKGLTALAAHLHPGGIFGMWSDGTPDEAFVQLLRTAIGSTEAKVVSFDNPLTGGQSSSTVYLAACRT